MLRIVAVLLRNDLVQLQEKICQVLLNARCNEVTVACRKFISSTEKKCSYVLRRNSFVLFAICPRSALTPSQVVLSDNRTGWIRIGFWLVFRDGRAPDAFVVAAATWLMYVGAVWRLAGRGARGWAGAGHIDPTPAPASCRPRLGARFESFSRMTA